MARAEFGSVISGTMLNQDIVPAFIEEIERITEKKQDALWEEWEEVEHGDMDVAADFVNELFETLNEYAPDYGYFGSNVGDGADYGFWLDCDWQERMQEDGVLVVSDLCEIPEQPVAVVNDHGNVTYGRMTTDGFVTHWALV